MYDGKSGGRGKLVGAPVDDLSREKWGLEGKREGSRFAEIRKKTKNRIDDHFTLNKGEERLKFADVERGVRC